MAEWKHDREMGRVVEAVPDEPYFNCQVVCSDVTPRDAALIVEAPAMEAWMRTFKSRPLGPDDFARLHDEAQAIFRRIDEARKGNP